VHYGERIQRKRFASPSGENVWACAALAMPSQRSSDDWEQRDHGTAGVGFYGA